MSSSNDTNRIEAGDLLIEKNASGEIEIHNLADGESVTIGTGGLSANAIDTEEDSNVIKAHNLPGTTLAQKIEEALTRVGSGGVIEVEPIDVAFDWDTEVIIDITNYDGITLDFRRVSINSTVSNPLIISGAGSTNFGGGGTHIVGGEWDMPDTGDAAVTIRDSLRVTVKRTTSNGNHNATVAVENVDYYCEGVRLDELMAKGGAATYDWRPASVTGGTGTDSFIHAIVGTGRGVTCAAPTDFGFRLRGSFLGSDFGMHRVSYPQSSPTGVRAFVIDAEMGDTPVGPLHAEQGSDGANTFLETGPSYQPPAFYRGWRNVNNNDIIRDGGSSDPLPYVSANTGGWEIGDFGTTASIKSNESVPELDFTEYNRTRINEPWVTKGSGRIARFLNDNGDDPSHYMGGDGVLYYRNDSTGNLLFGIDPSGALSLEGNPISSLKEYTGAAAADLDSQEWAFDTDHDGAGTPAWLFKDSAGTLHYWEPTGSK